MSLDEELLEKKPTKKEKKEFINQLKKRGILNEESLREAAEDFEQGIQGLGDYSVPSILEEGGMYAIREETPQQNEDEGWFADVFIIYDRKNKVALDVTPYVDNLLDPLNFKCSHEDPLEILSEGEVEEIEKFLTGELKPIYDYYFNSGTRAFEAREIPESSLRQKMLDMYSSYKTLRGCLKESEEVYKNIFAKFD